MIGDVGPTSEYLPPVGHDDLVVWRAALAAVSVPVVVQPNAGQPQMTAQGMRYARDPEEFARDLAPLAGLGAAVPGGCCGTDPRFVSALGARRERPA